MEGAARKVNGQTMRHLLVQAWRKFSWTIGVLVLLGGVQPLEAADFLIVEKVEGLSLYNKYQQEASRTERQLFVPFVPMKILKQNDMLGDGFTPCMQVEVDAQIFYLLKNDNGGLSRLGARGYEKTFNNAAALLDTVQLLSNKSILLSPINSQARHLSSHEQVVRVFRYQNLIYCRTLNAPSVFGWVDFNGMKEGREWVGVKHRVSTETSISSLVSQKIQQRVEEVNRVLTRLFRFFNAQTSQQKPTPAWIIESSNTALTCTLGGADDNKQFQESTFYLVNEIENITLGSAFQVTHSPGRIEIRPK